MIKDFNAVNSVLKFWICSILNLSCRLENTQDSFGTDEAGEKGFSRGVDAAAICLVAILGLTL